MIKNSIMLNMTKLINWKRIAIVFFVAVGVSTVVDRVWEWAFPNSSSHWDTTTVVAVVIVFIVIMWGRRGKGIFCKEEKNKEGGVK